jgi:hypothetical protein
LKTLLHTALIFSAVVGTIADDEEDEDEDFDAGGEDMSASSGGSLDEEAGR